MREQRIFFHLSKSLNSPTTLFSNHLSLPFNFILCGLVLGHQPCLECGQQMVTAVAALGGTQKAPSWERNQRPKCQAIRPWDWEVSKGFKGLTFSSLIYKQASIPLIISRTYLKLVKAFLNLLSFQQAKQFQLLSIFHVRFIFLRSFLFFSLNFSTFISMSAMRLL